MSSPNAGSGSASPADATSKRWWGNLPALTRFCEYLAATSDVHAVADIDPNARMVPRLAGQTSTPDPWPDPQHRRAPPILRIRQVPPLGHIAWPQPRCSPPTTTRNSSHGWPRHLVEHVMNQIKQPANLDRLPSPKGRLLTITDRCGSRISDASPSRPLASCTAVKVCLPALRQQKDDAS